MRMQSYLNVCAGAMLGWMGGCLLGMNPPSERIPHSSAGTSIQVISAPRIPAGTTVSVRLGGSVSSETARRGDSWRGVLVRDLVAASGARVEAGSAVVGIVSEARDARSTHAALDLRVISISAGGRIASVRAALDPVASGIRRASGRDASILIREGMVMVFRVQ